MHFLGLSTPHLVLNLLTSRTKGDAFEQAASEYLQQQGLSLIDAQARFKLGELDLIMQDKNCLVFVEVRFRKNTHYGGAATSISLAKQRKLRNAAYLWLAKHNLSAIQTEFRFDALTFEGDLKAVNWIKNIIIEG